MWWNSFHPVRLVDWASSPTVTLSHITPAPASSQVIVFFSHTTPAPASSSSLPNTVLYWMDTVQCHGFPTVALIRSVSLLISYEGCSFLLLPSKGTFDHVDGVDFCCFVDTFNIHSNCSSDVTWVRVTCSSDKFFLQKTCTESLSILFKIRCWLSSEFRTSWGACSVILKGR